MMHDMKRCATLAGLSMVALFLTSCASPRYAAWHPVFDPVDLSDVAIVMSKTGWRADGEFRSPADTELAEALQESVLDQLPRQAAAFGTAVAAPGLPDLPGEDLLAAEAAYGQVLDQAQTLIRRVRLIHLPVPAELSALARHADARHVMVVRTVAWRAGAGAQVGTAAAAVAASLLVPGYIFIPTGASHGTGVEILLIDAETSMVSWYGQHYADVDPRRDDHVDAVVTALMLQLYTGQRVEARDLIRWPTGQHVSAWLHEGGRISGHLEGREGLQVRLRQRDGSIESVSLTAVRSIRPTTGGRIFPTQRGPKMPHRLF